MGVCIHGISVSRRWTVEGMHLSNLIDCRTWTTEVFGMDFTYLSVTATDVSVSGAGLAWAE